MEQPTIFQDKEKHLEELNKYLQIIFIHMYFEKFVHFCLIYF